MTLYRLPEPEPTDARLTGGGLLLAVVLGLLAWGALLALAWCVARIAGVL